jgi:uncharacterized membrane protein YgcG
MKIKMKMHIPVVSALLIGFLAAGFAACAQAPAVGSPASARIVGTITAINGDTLTVKTDAGQAVQVVVPAAAVLKRIAPGQKDLSTAATIQFSDLAVGDRALVKLDPGAPTQALQIIAVKQEDLAAKQKRESEDWQQRGVGGLVKSVDAAAGVIVLTSGTGVTAKAVTVRTTKATVLKRYAAASVRYDDAQPAPIDAIHAGDQLRARGAKNADGTQIDAEEVVSGSFRNISGTIASLDAATTTLTIKDLATKKLVTVHIPADAQMRRLPDRMAQMLAARLKGTTIGGPGSWGRPLPSAAGAPVSARGGGAGGFGAGGGGGGAMGGGGQWSGGGAGGAGGARTGAGGGQGQSGAQNGGSFGPGGAGSFDPQQMLSRAPAIPFTDLKKGEAVMVVSTDGTTEVTAITLMAGVEPLLEAPAAQNLLSNWSMSTGAGAGESAQ